jgi:hypothetical protein
MLGNAGQTIAVNAVPLPLIDSDSVFINLAFRTYQLVLFNAPYFCTLSDCHFSDNTSKCLK